MTAIVLLFIVGTLLLAGEVFLPGGVAGTIGAVGLLAGCWLAFSEYGPGIGSLATAAACVLLALALYVELVWLPRSKIGRGLIVQWTNTGQSQPPPAEAAKVVGLPAVALTTLAPSGYVSVAGRRYEAYCRSGHATRGAALTVEGVDNFQLIVSETKIP